MAKKRTKKSVSASQAKASSSARVEHGFPIVGIGASAATEAGFQQITV